MKIKDVIEWIFSGIIIVWFFVMLILFDGWLMELLGSNFKTISSLFIFLISSEIFGLPMELFSSLGLNMLLYLEHINLAWAKGLYFVLSVASSIISMAIVDHFMDSVYTTGMALLIVAITSALFGLFTIGIDLDDDIY